MYLYYNVIGNNKLMDNVNNLIYDLVGEHNFFSSNLFFLEPLDRSP